MHLLSEMWNFEILYAKLIVGPAATEQCQIDVALISLIKLLNGKLGSSNSHLFTSFGMTRPGFKPRPPNYCANKPDLCTDPMHICIIIYKLRKLRMHFDREHHRWTACQFCCDHAFFGQDGGGGQDSALLTKPYEDSRGTRFLQHYNFCRENIHAYTCMIEQVSSWKYGKRVYLHLECK